MLNTMKSSCALSLLLVFFMNLAVFAGMCPTGYQARS